MGVEYTDEGITPNLHLSDETVTGIPENPSPKASKMMRKRYESKRQVRYSWIVCMCRKTMHL